MSPMDCHRPIKRNKLIYLIIITYVAPNIYRYTYGINIYK
jgi:hypothetical protein